MTLLWFSVWLVSNVLGDNAPLMFDPVNWWTGLLLFSIAVDLAGQMLLRREDASEADRPAPAASDVATDPPTRNYRRPGAAP